MIGVLSNFYLIYFHKENYLTTKFSFIFINIDIFQLSFLLFLTGGITNPFIVFVIIPCIFSSTNLDIRTNLMLGVITIIAIIFFNTKVIQ